MYFKAPGDMIVRLERTLEIDDDIMRYLTLRMDAKMLRHFEKRKSEPKRIPSEDATPGKAPAIEKSVPVETNDAEDDIEVDEPETQEEQETADI